MTFWACLEWVAHAQPAERRCNPLVIAGKPCGKICRTPDNRYQIRGCKPLNQIVRT